MKIFKQRKAELFNRQVVRKGDLVSFINSDKVKCTGKIERRKFDAINIRDRRILKKGTLYFWNANADIPDYRNAKLEREERKFYDSNIRL